MIFVKTMNLVGPVWKKPGPCKSPQKHRDCEKTGKWGGAANKGGKPWHPEAGRRGKIFMSEQTGGGEGGIV